MTELTANEIVSELYLARIMDKRKTLVMVEGKTDRALWVEYMADCALFPTRGKNVIIDALKSYGLRGLSGIAAIVDLDYWLISQADELHIPNLLYDDCCPDMESILLNSSALKKVLRHAFSDYGIEQIHEFAEKLKQAALCLAMELGYFRLLNHNKDYGLDFKAIHFEEFIDKNRLEFNQEWAAKRLAQDQAGISGEALLQEVAELRKKYPPGNIQLCRGKDVIDIMAVILPTLFKAKFGDDLPQRINDKELTENLRMAYEYGYFTETSLFNCIRKWESNNVPFRIIQN